MSLIQNEEWLLNLQEDFDYFLAKKDWKNCQALIDQTGEQGFESDALRLHQTLNRAQAKESEDRMEFGTLSDEYESDPELDMSDSF